MKSNRPQHHSQILTPTEVWAQPDLRVTGLASTSLPTLSPLPNLQSRIIVSTSGKSESRPTLNPKLPALPNPLTSKPVPKKVTRVQPRNPNPHNPLPNDLPRLLAQKHKARNHASFQHLPNRAQTETGAEAAHKQRARSHREAQLSGGGGFVIFIYNIRDWRHGEGRVHWG